MKMKPPSGPKKQTQNKANFFKSQNRLPENPATPHVFMKLHWNWTVDYSIIRLMQNLG